MEREKNILEIESRSKEEVLEENEYLKTENKKLIEENEKIRDIFRFATVEFESRERRIKFLEGRLVKVNQEVQRLRQEKEYLSRKIEELEGKNRILNKIAFGKKNEKKQKQEIRQIKTRGRKKGHIGCGRKIPENLPVEEEIIEIPPDERFCPD